MQGCRPVAGRLANQDSVNGKGAPNRGRFLPVGNGRGGGGDARAWVGIRRAGGGFRRAAIATRKRLGFRREMPALWEEMLALPALCGAVQFTGVVFRHARARPFPAARRRWRGATTGIRRSPRIASISYRDSTAGISSRGAAGVSRVAGRRGNREHFLLWGTGDGDPGPGCCCGPVRCRCGAGASRGAWPAGRAERGHFLPYRG